MSHTVETTDILVYNLHGMATYFKNQADKQQGRGGRIVPRKLVNGKCICCYKIKCPNSKPGVKTLMHIHGYQGTGGSQLFLNLATSQLARTDLFNYLEPPESETHLVLQP